MGQIAKLGDDGEGVTEKRSEVQRFRDNGVKPSPGILVFNQIDLDGSGTVDRSELKQLLTKLTEINPAPGLEPVALDEMLAKLDSDANGTIDEEEWLANL